MNMSNSMTLSMGNIARPSKSWESLEELLLEWQVGNRKTSSNTSSWSMDNIVRSSRLWLEVEQLVDK